MPQMQVVSDHPPPAEVPRSIGSTPDARGEFGSREANRLLGNFSRAFQNGDVSGMRAMFSTDPAMGVLRHVDAGYEHAIDIARERGVRVPMLDEADS